MSRGRTRSARSVAPALLAVLILAGLGGLVVKRRAARIRDAYTAHRMLEELGRKENELGYLQGELEQRCLPGILLLQADSIGLRVDRGIEMCVTAPPRRTEGGGQ